MGGFARISCRLVTSLALWLWLVVLAGRIQEAMEVYEAAGAEPQLQALQGLVEASMPQPAEREEDEEELEDEDLEDDIDAPLDLPMDGPEHGGRTEYSQEPQ